MWSNNESETSNIPVSDRALRSSDRCDRRACCACSILPRCNSGPLLESAPRAEDIERTGVPRGDAERRARIEFGSAQGYKEDVRRSCGLSPIDGLGT